MKIICLQENLKRGLSIAERIIGKNLTLPILNNLFLKTDKGRLKISSTNLEIGINCWILGKVEQDGEIVVPAKTLSSFISHLPNKKIEISVKDGVLYLNCENHKAKIKGYNVDDFPIIPTIEEQIVNNINKESFKNGLSQVVGMAIVSDIRPEISGILFNFDDNFLKIAATDSFRLAEKIISNKNNNKGSLIIPQRTVQELIRVLGEEEMLGGSNLIKIILGSNQIMFDLGYVQIISRLIDGQYPDYQQIIPKSFKVKFVVNKENLIKAVKIASFFSGKISDVSFKVNSSDRAIEISSQNIDIGENKTQIPAEIDGKNLNVSFNWHYILDGLNNIPTNKVLLEMNDEAGPTIIKPVGEDGYLYVVMPIKAI